MLRRSLQIALLSLACVIAALVLAAHATDLAQLVEPAAQDNVATPQSPPQPPPLVGTEPAPASPEDGVEPPLPKVSAPKLEELLQPISEISVRARRRSARSARERRPKRPHPNRTCEGSERSVAPRVRAGVGLGPGLRRLAAGTEHDDRHAEGKSRNEGEPGQAIGHGENSKCCKRSLISCANMVSAGLRAASMWDEWAGAVARTVHGRRRACAAQSSR
jgi:hypothetical protein